MAGDVLSLPEGAVPLAPSAKLSGRDRPVRYELLRVRFEPARAWGSAGRRFASRFPFGEIRWLFCVPSATSPAMFLLRQSALS